MHAVAWQSPAGVYAFGPFEDPSEPQKWANSIAPFIADPSQYPMMSVLVVEADASAWEQPMAGAGSGSCYDQGDDRDKEATAFLAVVVTDTLSVAAGPIPTREDAHVWFNQHRMNLGGSNVLILPLLAPSLAVAQIQ